MSTSEAEEQVRGILRKNGKSDDKIDQFLAKARKRNQSILQIMEECFWPTPVIEAGCRQAMDKHRGKKE